MSQFLPFLLSLNSQGIVSNIIFHLLPLPLPHPLSLSHTRTLCTIPKLFPKKKRKNKSPVLSLSPYTLLCPHFSPFF
ncbi:hypothetical protein NC653_013865 [Populus alba x Populus x berolinensis]|uniref:Uncharacterized protein n=1 Tax=Populus alba x Populus x berolinensis TaxID=444605 RepID=A0AAD6QVM2_9ROSI|nr:hypothetical protein NC653_013865 [Populus alba x Populus x berolinensis]